MLSTAEKTAILRSVSIFAEIPEPELTLLSNIVEEVSLPADTRVFSKGDPGNCMYVIVQGKVRVHDGDFLLNYLGARDLFGEMAVLDAEPRLASVTTVDDTQLLKIDQDLLYGLMRTQIDVVRGIIRVLAQRLRARVRDMAEDFEYMRQFARVTAAASALEAGVYQDDALDEVSARTDALGQLSRVFQKMATEVAAREQRLKQQVQELRIEIDLVKQAKEVEELTSGDYFQDLQRKARLLRGRAADSA